MDEEKQPLPEHSETQSHMRLVVGSALAMLVGVLLGTIFDLPQELTQGKFGPDHSPFALDYVFSHFLGIFVSAAVALLIYVIVRRRTTTLLKTPQNMKDNTPDKITLIRKNIYIYIYMCVFFFFGGGGGGFLSNW